MGVGEAGKVRGETHLRLFQVEGFRIGVVKEALVHEPFTQILVHFHAGRQHQSCRHAQDDNFLHLLQEVVVKCIVAVHVASVGIGRLLIFQQRKTEGAAVVGQGLFYTCAAQDNAVGILSG